MQKIVPNLWFAGDAAEAGEFYAAALPETTSRVAASYPDDGLPDFQRQLAGLPLVVEVEVGGHTLSLINAGSEFRPNGAMSFTLNFDPSRDSEARARLDATWEHLVGGGEVRMPLGEYPFSPRYGWVEDRFGVNWQLFEPNPDGDSRPFLMPSLLFCGAAQNRAGEAIEHYTSLLPDSRVGMQAPYGAQSGPATPEALMYSDFTLAGQWFVAMDSGVEQDFSFTPGNSLQVSCVDQDELDRLWEALSTVPEAEQCGWCVDRFGLSWQVVPQAMDELLITPAAYQAMLGMKKIVIADLRAAR
ncbi:VOC family protein [Rhodococcus sp. D2-41]|uniref:VOC family protein n=1 Tax=Speluncibacter jeojiensis TaxID=2710754 RepID=UPI00240FF18D|nr:VOC family protein [Rhodococcus sp. D2-41]MDG3009893.1 VOC family protein [Rhodococcus sp. D2-41]